MSMKPGLPASGLRCALVALTCLMMSDGAVHARNEPPPKFAALFNGEDLSGWRGGTGQKERRV